MSVRMERVRGQCPCCCVDSWCLVSGAWKRLCGVLRVVHQPMAPPGTNAPPLVLDASELHVKDLLARIAAGADDGTTPT